MHIRPAPESRTTTEASPGHEPRARITAPSSGRVTMLRCSAKEIVKHSRIRSGYQRTMTCRTRIGKSIAITEIGVPWQGTPLSRLISNRQDATVPNVLSHDDIPFEWKRHHQEFSGYPVLYKSTNMSHHAAANPLFTHAGLQQETANIDKYLRD